MKMAGKEKPILFSTPMVQAILEDRKTKTRRVMTPQPVIDNSNMWNWKDCQWMNGGLGFPASGIEDHAKYLPGDILWVRETWNEAFKDNACTQHAHYIYRTDSPGIERWRPSIFMPKEAARIFLRVKNVRVERLQEISEVDAQAEGIKIGRDFPGCGNACVNYRTAFSLLWDSINAKRGFGWDTNPWVWVYEFERCAKPQGWPNTEAA